MKSILDDSSIELTCPHCSAKFSERLGKLKTNPKLTCRKCGGFIQISADQLRQETAKVDKAITDLKRTLGRLGK